MSLMSSFKGLLGETVINVAMWLKLEKNVYHRLNNVTLPLSNGGSTQIDHVIVSVYGIFVIETKNYKGWIFGSEKQKQWTQVIMGRKYKFQNPLRQNYLHVKTLVSLLDLELRYFHSMIAFIGECELKTRDELPEHVLTSGMVSYIKKKQTKLLDEDEVKAIVSHIESNRFDKSWKTNRDHKAYLKNKHSNDAKKSAVDSIEKIHTKPIIAEAVKSKEVHKWSGQVAVASDSLIESPVVSNAFITPFDALDETASTKPIKIAAASLQNPTCPKCQSEMVKWIAKKGARQGQSFYGCSQFPKCRGVVNVG